MEFALVAHVNEALVKLEGAPAVPAVGRGRVDCCRSRTRNTPPAWVADVRRTRRTCSGRVTDLPGCARLWQIRTSGR
jgi:hypothetical protein